MVTGQVQGSTWHPQTAEQAAMDRMQLQHQWDLENVGRERNAWLQHYQDTQALAEAEKQKRIGEARQAFNTVYTPYLTSQWDTYANKAFAPPVEDVLANTHPGQVYTQTGPGGQMGWKAATGAPQGWVQGNLQNMWNTAYANLLLRDMFGGPGAGFSPMAPGRK